MKKKCAIAIILAMITAPAFAGTKITGSGASVELACWNYNQKANEHARVRGSCWGVCKSTGVVQSNGKFSYTFNNPNHDGSCPKRKYDGGRGLNDADFYSAYPPPAGVPNPYAQSEASQSRSSGYKFRNAHPAAGQGTLLLWNTTTKDVRFDCEVLKSKAVYSLETFILPPNNRYEKGYQSFDNVLWEASCIKS